MTIVNSQSIRDLKETEITNWVNPEKEHLAQGTYMFRIQTHIQKADGIHF